jgi:hypothetical protein
MGKGCIPCIPPLWVSSSSIVQNGVPGNAKVLFCYLLASFLARSRVLILSTLLTVGVLVRSRATLQLLCS